MKVDNQARSNRPKTLDSKAFLCVIDANPVSSTCRVSGELCIQQFICCLSHLQPWHLSKLSLCFFNMYHSLQSEKSSCFNILNLHTIISLISSYVYMVILNLDKFNNPKDLNLICWFEAYTSKLCDIMYETWRIYMVNKMVKKYESLFMRFSLLDWVTEEESVCFYMHIKFLCLGFTLKPVTFLNWQGNLQGLY